MILGVDPGGTGAIACLDDDGGLICVFDIPQHAGIVSPALILDELERWEIATDGATAVIEDVHSMPHQGVASAFKFGRAHGTVIGVLAGLRIPISYVSPAKWKRAMGLSKDKDQSRRLAIETWPQRSHLFARKRDDGRAEAALIARYGQSLQPQPISTAPKPWEQATA